LKIPEEAGCIGCKKGLKLTQAPEKHPLGPEGLSKQQFISQLVQPFEREREFAGPCSRFLPEKCCLIPIQA
jgi:hypothetical protein